MGVMLCQSLMGGVASWTGPQFHIGLMGDKGTKYRTKVVHSKDKVGAVASWSYV